MRNLIRKTTESIRDDLGIWLILTVIMLFAATVLNRYLFGELTPVGMVTLVSFVVSGIIALPTVLLLAMIRE